jgi:hypothetical protein
MNGVQRTRLSPARVDILSKESSENPDLVFKSFVRMAELAKRSTYLMNGPRINVEASPALITP